MRRALQAFLQAPREFHSPGRLRHFRCEAVMADICFFLARPQWQCDCQLLPGILDRDALSIHSQWGTAAQVRWPWRCLAARLLSRSLSHTICGVPQGRFLHLPGDIASRFSAALVLALSTLLISYAHVQFLGTACFDLS